MNVTVADMMRARDARAERQRQLLARNRETLLCFTMNIPGPVKRSAEIENGFAIGKRRLRGAFLRAEIHPLYEEETIESTGCEIIYVLPTDPLALKRLTAEVEERDALGRLFDLDVLRPDGIKVDRQEIGLPGRRCLLCGEAAQVCARSRRHSVEALVSRTYEILREAIRAELGRRVSSIAARALLFEVNSTPKPGLVDRLNSGSHRDMDIFTFASSTAALAPYFGCCAKAGYDLRGAPAEETLAAIRPMGKQAEEEMLLSTGGVNTHKGAVFSLGILAAAAGRTGEVGSIPAERLLSLVAEICRGITAQDFAGLTEENAHTAGQQLFLRYGIPGVRGEAERGFPLVRKYGLPKLRAGLSAGLSLNDAGCAALLSMLAGGTDTNVIHRSSFARAKGISARAAELLAAQPFPSRETLIAFDRELTAENISPGGTADLLALTFFLYFMEEGE